MWKNKNSEASRLIGGISPPPPLSQCYFSLSVWCVLCSFTPFLPVFFVFLRKNLVLLHLMTDIWFLQLSNLWKEKALWKENFCYQWIIQFNTDSCCEHMAGDVNIYSCGFVSLLVPECDVYLCVYVCETHTKIALVLRYQGSTYIHNIIKGNNTLNVARLPIQSKKQDIKNSSGGEGWRQQEIGVGQNFKKLVQAI